MENRHNPSKASDAKAVRPTIYNNEKNSAPIDSFVKMWYNKKKTNRKLVLEDLLWCLKEKISIQNTNGTSR